MKNHNHSKTFITALAILIFPSLVFAQKNSFVIGQPSSSVIINSIDTIVQIETGMSNTESNFYLDVDGNGINDFLFKSFHQNGSSESQPIDYIHLFSFDGYSFVIDTGVADYVTVDILISNDSIIYDSIYTEIVSKKLQNDLIDTNLIFSTYKPITNYKRSSYSSLCWIYHSLDNWIGETGYIGFKKDTLGSIYYGWFKIEVFNYCKFKVYEYAVEDQLIDVKEVVNQSVNLYPNPMRDKLRISGENISQVRIFNTQGSLVEELFPTTGTSSILQDVSHLNSGMYLIQVKDQSKTQTFKVIKR